MALLVVLVLVLAAARAYTRHRSRERRGQRSFLRGIARDTLEGLADPIDRARGALLAGISLVTWAMWGVAAWFVAQAVGIELSLLEAVFITAVINLGVAIPSSPGFIGTYQWLAVSSLALFGVATDSALAFGILMQAVWYVPTTVVGGTMLLLRALGVIGQPSGASVALGKTGASG